MFSKIGALLSNFVIFKILPGTNWIVKKGMTNTKNCTFRPKLNYVFGYNIYADNVNLGGTFFQDIGKINIGKNTIFGYENMLLTAGYKDTKSLLKEMDIRDINIGRNVWITSRVIILGGVTIGDNVIIGAGSVVVKDIPSNTFAAGNPCKVIKKMKNEK